MKKYRKPIAAVAVLVSAGVGISLATGSNAAKKDDPRQLALLVQTAVARSSASDERGFTGVVAARVQSNLGFRVAGKVVERLVDVGQVVHAGQTLLRIDPKDLSLALASRDSSVAAARAVMVQAAADEARYRGLLADGWATRQRYEQVKAVLDTAKAQLSAAQAQAEVTRNETGYAVLLADADGTVVDTLAEPGQVVAAGQIVVRLAHAGAREATVNLPETARPAIGSVAQATLYGRDGARATARLRQLSDAADPQSRTFEARYVLEGEAASAPLGSTVTVWLPRVAEAGSETEVPLGAVLDDGRRSGVWVVDRAGSNVAFRPVQLRRVGQETALVTGLTGGETVVALGAHLLHDGDRVRVAGTQASVR